MWMWLEVRFTWRENGRALTGPLLLGSSKGLYHMLSGDCLSQGRKKGNPQSTSPLAPMLPPLEAGKKHLSTTKATTPSFLRSTQSSMCQLPWELNILVKLRDSTQNLLTHWQCMMKRLARVVLLYSARSGTGFHIFAVLHATAQCHLPHLWLPFFKVDCPCLDKTSAFVTIIIS
jgi:hypothetical protein